VCCVAILEQIIVLPVLKDLQRYFMFAVLSDKIIPCGSYTNVMITASAAKPNVLY
jgi:hypothetical protein